jgi:PhnB protein
MIGHYLLFSGNCEEALKTYEKAFDTKVIVMQRYRDMPSSPDFPIPESDLNLVLHSRLVIDGSEIMCADSREVPLSGNNMYISITSDDAEKVKRAWEVLKDGGQINMELTPSFFAKLHGNLRDRYGINWMFTAE